MWDTLYNLNMDYILYFLVGWRLPSTCLTFLIRSFYYYFVCVSEDNMSGGRQRSNPKLMCYNINVDF
jgi:hypothetical protein